MPRLPAPHPCGHPLPCGHPAACVATGDDGYCRWCEEVAGAASLAKVAYFETFVATLIVEKERRAREAAEEAWLEEAIRAEGEQAAAARWVESVEDVLVIERHEMQRLRAELREAVAAKCSAEAALTKAPCGHPQACTSTGTVIAELRAACGWCAAVDDAEIARKRWEKAYEDCELLRAALARAEKEA